MPSAPEALAAVLRSGRQAKGWTQEDLADAAQMGTSTLRAIEAGRARGPSVYTVLRLMRSLDVPAATLQNVMACLDQPPEGAMSRKRTGGPASRPPVGGQ